MTDYSPQAGAEWLLIRHAPRAEPDRLAGRRDVAAVLPDERWLAALRAMAGSFDRLVTSPALRCRQTAQALFPGIDCTEDAGLWEQDFGQWEGLAYGKIPDIGPLERTGLAAHCPPCGESYLSMAARVTLSLKALPAGRSVIIAHAGTVRSALGLALGDVAAGLAFEIAPLSATLIRALPGGQFSIGFVNRIVS